MKHKSICLPLALATVAATATPKAERPNIILIITDQQNLDKVSLWGDKAVRTPNIDHLAESGYIFHNAYCAFPLSMPSRFSMFSGHQPSTFGVRGNNAGQADISQIKAGLMGTLFAGEGYDTYYGGKIHLPQDNDNKSVAYYGFKELYSRQIRDRLGVEAAAKLRQIYGTGRPFLLVASFLNPHDICSFDDAIGKVNDGKDPHRFPLTNKHYQQALSLPVDALPPLLSDHAQMSGAPAKIPGYAPPFTVGEWRIRRWVYDRLVEDADSDMVPLVRAIDELGVLKNTIVIFTSDHGDLDSSHKMELKSSPLDRCNRIPFIFTGQGIKKGEDRANYVNNGLDLIPTLCELASIPVAKNMPGRSLKPLLDGSRSALERDHIFSEGSVWYSVIFQNRYKYTMLEASPATPMLFDLQKDPQEMENLAQTPELKEICARCEKLILDDLAARGLKIVKPGAKNDLEL
ncbi:sulfatase [Bacteroidia bacterium]|nr:sulfatase [Bacteroidia bacterium]